MKDLSTILDDYKNNGKNKEAIKRALTEGKLKEEMVVYRSNVDKHAKNTKDLEKTAKNKPTFEKSHSLQTSLISKLASSSSKNSHLKRPNPKMDKLAVTSLKALSNKVATRPSSNHKAVEKNLSYIEPDMPLSNSQTQIEYMVSQRPILTRKPAPRKESTSRTVMTPTKSLTKRVESASVKNIILTTVTKEPHISSSCSNLLRHTRFNTPSICSKTVVTTDIHQTSELPVYTKASTRKRKSDSPYDNIVGAFSKKKPSATLSRDTDRKPPALGLSKLGSHLAPQEQHSYGSKRTSQRFEPPAATVHVTAGKKRAPTGVIQRDLLETQLLISKLRSVTEHHKLNLGRVVSFTSTQPSQKEAETNPLSSIRTRELEPPSSDFLLEQEFRALIKRTNKLYREIYTD